MLENNEVGEAIEELSIHIDQAEKPNDELFS